jgi:hypothetical protein
LNFFKEVSSCREWVIYIPAISVSGASLFFSPAATVAIYGRNPQKKIKQYGTGIPNVTELPPHR